MDWDDLRVFLAVARAESLSGAGRLLKVDAATVGRRVARLEEALDTKLFLKSPQGYTLTDPGARMLPHAEAMEQAMSGAAEEISGQTGKLTGQMRIGAPDGIANYLLPQICRDISNDNPELELQIVALPRVFNLSKREADMAIAVSRPTAGRLTVQKLTDYRLSLAAHRSYLAKMPPICSRADLLAHRMVGYIPDMIFDKELDYMAETGVDRVTLASNSVSVQMQMLRAGGGIGIVHDFARPFVPGLERVLPDEITLTRSFWLLRHADDRRSERLSRIAEVLGQGLRREVARLEGGGGPPGL
ncbi:LysR family transcriptional regulator [Thioclava sp. SK-1]|uniref:LysR family transcriptional regulator n=1 Tax=Thioclava sp. SK-1 TaxID=1889770 RepID=UPI00082540E3|nr:LysR family transcriptional regulator [Thioclava sp. SK-1]OCX67229.1 LysR family transcriptional regulator [Thioclava sp. SK-1]